MKNGGKNNCCVYTFVQYISTHPKLINKENSRSEIWHYFAYKTDDDGEGTDLNAPVCKRCYKSRVTTETHQTFLSICHCSS